MGINLQASIFLISCSKHKRINLRLYNERGTLLVAQMVEALRYMPEGRGFDSRCSDWNFSLT